MPGSLVVYYTRTGNTRRLAEEIRDLTGADTEELVEADGRTGTPGWVRSVAEAMLHLRPRLRPCAHDPRRYDIVFVGGPVWMGRLAPAVRSYVAEIACHAPRVAFFSTQRGVPSVQAWHDLEHVGGFHAVATLAERVRTLAGPARDAELQRFVARARHGRASTFDRGSSGQPAHG